MDTAELNAILQEVRGRVRGQSPGAQVSLPVPDLMPLVHARDAAEAKVASIGMVNPRRGGPLNWIIQQLKKTVARALDWHVREQVEFNRNVMACVQSTLEALEDMRRALQTLDGTWREMQTELRELKDIRSHWIEWRAEWDHRLVANEHKLLRGLADLNASMQHRAALAESSMQNHLQLMNADFTAALNRSGEQIQKRLWEDMAQIRSEYERLIHTELRLVRQRPGAAPPAAPAPPVPAPDAFPAFDYARFAERFRGSAEYVRQGQRFYLPYFAGRHEVLDIGCGRGEFLELMREASVPARGIDLSQESVAACLEKGLQAEAADLFAYLAALPEQSLDGIFSSQVVEHLPPGRLPEMIQLAASRLQRGGILVLETPNPECLAIFATHFFLDPTHTRPVPHPLLSFYMEENGLGRIEVHPRAPAVETMPSLAALPPDFHAAFFGSLDYAIIGTKL